MQKLEAILFDLGNTLIYFDGQWSAVLAEARQAALDAFHRAGLQVDIEPFLHIFQETLENNYARREGDLLERPTTHLLRDVLCALGYANASEALIAAARNAFYAVTQTHWLPELDAEPVLHSLGQAGYRMGIISNAGDDKDVQTLVDKAGIRAHFDFVMTSAAFGQRKPSPAIFRAALQHWTLEPDRVAMVGDTLNADILGANQSGLFSIWITRRVPAAHTVIPEHDLSPDRIITSLQELPETLAKLTL